MALLFVNVHRGGGGTGKNMTLALRSPKGEADPAGGVFLPVPPPKSGGYMKSTIRKYAPPIFHCINDFGQGSLAALIPFFIANFNLNYYQSASIIFCNTVVASIAQPILGYVADRWRVPWFIPVGFAVTLVSISAIALATSYEMILALALMSGVGAALFHPEAALLVNRTQSHENHKKRY